MSAKHTPGPWRVFGYDIGTSPDETLAVVCAMDDNTDDANARLIAAAPEMLKMLEVACDCLEAWMEMADPDYVREPDDEVLAAIAAVIARAKGE